MRAMILAAGRGERMGALTQDVPKPLLKVRGHYLIEYSLRALIRAGFKEIVINVSYHRQKIIDALGDGERYGVAIHYSEEETALETGGGILQALPLLGNAAFLVLSCDVICNYPLQHLPKKIDSLAHIVLVNNPDFHPRGDFCLDGNHIYLGTEKTYTFGNIGVYHPDLFAGYQPGKFRLGDVLKRAIAEQRVTGEVYSGIWYNVGKPEHMQQANAALDTSLLS